MKKNFGFTLVEIIVVILIMAVLAAIAFPVLLSYVPDALNAKYIQQAQSIYSVLQVEQAHYTIDNEVETIAATYQDATANSAIITQVNDQLDSELNLNSLTYYGEPDTYKGEDVPANSFLLDFTALDGKAKAALIIVNKRVIIFDGESSEESNLDLDLSSILDLFNEKKANIVVDGNAALTTKNLQDLLEGNYAVLKANENALIDNSDELYWVPIVSPDASNVYFAASDKTNANAGTVQSSLVVINGVYYAHFNKDDEVDNQGVSADGSDYALLTSISSVGSTVDCNNSNQGYWKIVK